ncbi:MAG TPA: NAD(P)H-hydrate dehydratase, partial [Nannocystaceae bacterium]|nr:NAD(P)H-hydrate dehydratase [Nannocystaceae bacterium]
MASRHPPKRITPGLLLRMSTACFAEAGAERREQVVILGGSPEDRWPPLFAALGATRAGTHAVQARAVAARTRVAEIDALIDPCDDAADRVVELLAECDAVVIGPGLRSGAARVAAMQAVQSTCPDTPCVVVGASLLDLTRARPFERLIVVCTAFDAARFLGLPRKVIVGHADAAAAEIAAHLAATIVLLGGSTLVAAADGELFEGAPVDEHVFEPVRYFLAGVAGGLLASGAAPLNAALWAVHV